MAVTLNGGEVVNSCDATTGFNQGSISGDDDFVEGTGALGAKTSNTYRDFYTTTLGATSPYDFSSGGGEFGYHMIMYFGAKSPLNTTAGQRLIVGNGTDRGEWYVPLTGLSEPKISIFVSRVVDLARDFDRIAAGTWTLAGNPAQLSNITQMGGGLQTTVSIMGSFNNTQIDQITIGLGVRVDAGTVGTPNDFETCRTQDEDTSIWGWISSVVGKIVCKGGIAIGPATGSATSVFVSSDESLTFAAELVASGFYDISARGTATDLTWTRLNIDAEDSSIARWNITMDSTIQTHDVVGGVWIGGDEITLDGVSDLDGVTVLDCVHLTQNGATLTNLNIEQAATADGVEFILADDPGLISDCNFVFSDGHAIRCDTTGTYDWSGNVDSGYGGTRGTNLTSSSGSTDAMFYNNSGGLITLNVSGGGLEPSVRNGAGATTQVNNNKVVTFDQMRDNTEVRIYTAGTTTELAGIEDATAGSADNRSFTASIAAGTSVDYVLHNFQPGDEIYETIRVNSFTWPSVDQTVIVQQRIDRNAEN